jgi:hypothetical protein
MLASLVLMPIATTSAIPKPWGWIPGTVHYQYVGSSVRDVSMCTFNTDAVVTNKNISYAGQQYSNMLFGTNTTNKVPITVPKASYYSAPFFLKTIGPNYLWCQVYLVKDGNGTLALAGGVLQNVNVSITATGNGAGGFSVTKVYSGGPAPAGSCLLDMPLNMSVWLGTSATDSRVLLFLFKMNFPMTETTGFIKANINDAAGPYPPTSISMNGYHKNATGVPFNSTTGAVILAGAGAGLDIFANIPLVGPAYTDYIFTDYGVMTQSVVGGIWVPVDRVILLAPYIGLVSAIVLAAATAAVFFKYRKKP